MCVHCVHCANTACVGVSHARWALSLRVGRRVATHYRMRLELMPAWPIATSISGCDPKETSSCRDTKKCVATPTGPSLERHQFLIATPKGQPMSRHHESCRDTKLHVPCRDTKKCVATQPQLPCSFRVATPKAMSRHPNGCLRRDIKIMSRPRPSLVPASTMS